MTELTFYHGPRCQYSARVRLVLEHLGIPYEPVEIDPTAVPADFHSISPHGLVPAITYRGQHLAGSNIINEFLDEVFAGGLMPEDPMRRGHARWLMAEADEHWIPVVRALRQADAKVDREAARAAQEAALRALREIERRFQEGGPYLMGQALSLADVAFAPTIVALPRMGMHVPHALIRTRRWADALAALPAMQRVLEANERTAPGVLAGGGA